MTLHRTVSEAWGEEAADTLFELVAPAGDRVATGRDVETLRGEIEAQGIGLRGEIEAQGTELRGAIEAQGTELRREMEAMEHRIVGSFERRLNETFTAQTRTLLVSQLAALVTIAGLAFGLR